MALESEAIADIPTQHTTASDTDKIFLEKAGVGGGISKADFLGASSDELGYLAGVTGPLQSQINDRPLTSTIYPQSELYTQTESDARFGAIGSTLSPGSEWVSVSLSSNTVWQNTLGYAVQVAVRGDGTSSTNQTVQVSTDGTSFITIGSHGQSDIQSGYFGNTTFTLLNGHYFRYVTSGATVLIQRVPE
ncbi:MAG: hypothetical protein ABJ360_22585 [Roseobacter sp.]